MKPPPRHSLFTILFPLFLASCGSLHTLSTTHNFPPQGHFLQTPTYTAHYIRAGSGPPLIYIHGALGSTRDLSDSPLFPLLTAHFDTIAFDRPGFGYSHRPHNAKLSLQDHARILHDNLAQLHLSQKPILLGHSMGGAVALAYAELYPNDTAALVLLAAPAFPTSPPSALNKLAATPLLGDLFLQTLAQPLGCLFGPSNLHQIFGTTPIPPTYEHASLALALRPSEFRADAQDRQLLNASLQKMIPLYPQIKIPVAILQGTDDQNVSPQKNALPLHTAIPHSTLTLIRNTAHALQFAAPEKILTTLHSLPPPPPTSNTLIH